MSYYILTPALVKSRGPELCHQFCNAFNQINNDKKCYIAYTEGVDDTLKIVDEECLPPFEKYETEHVHSIEDIFRDEDAVIIINEMQTNSLNLFPKQKKVIWWMSVDNYFRSKSDENTKLIKEKADFHLVQSFYAMEFVKNTFNIEDNKVMYLGDYISEEYGQFLFPGELRKNRGVYNPHKGFEYAKKIIDRCSDIEWIPLENMAEKQMILNMQLAKIYIDFGHHPGMDRIPREAALCGCCIVTNRDGSAAYSEDVPIDDEYKFENVTEQIDEIAALLESICENYNMHSTKFDDYRVFINAQKDQFKEDVAKFSKIKL